MNPLQVRESRATSSLSGIYDPQIENAGDIHVTSLPRIILSEYQTAVTRQIGDSIPAMLVRPFATDMRRRARARINHLDRVSI
jgi:hypothetical protein